MNNLTNMKAILLENPTMYKSKTGKLYTRAIVCDDDGEEHNVTAFNEKAEILNSFSKGDVVRLTGYFKIQTDYPIQFIADAIRADNQPKLSQMCQTPAAVSYTVSGVVVSKNTYRKPNPRTIYSVLTIMTKTGQYVNVYAPGAAVRTLSRFRKDDEINLRGCFNDSNHRFPGQFLATEILLTANTMFHQSNQYAYIA